MTETAKIYGLYDPEDSDMAVVYVGRTVTPLNVRLNQHTGFARRHEESVCLRSVWIRSILARGLKPGIKELEEVAIDEAIESEGWWTAHFRSLGVVLLNEQSHTVGALHMPASIEWTPEMLAMLGQYSDSDLAEQFGVDRKTIEYRRTLLGIKRKPQTNFVIPPMGGWNKKDLPEELIEQLGTMPDHQLGTLFGMSKAPIMRARKARGIPSYAEQTGNQTRFHKGMTHPRGNSRGRGKVIALPRKQRKSRLPSGITQMRMTL